jgi:hypothetical protein
MLLIFSPLISHYAWLSVMSIIIHLMLYSIKINLKGGLYNWGLHNCIKVYILRLYLNWLNVSIIKQRQYVNV